MNTETRLFSMVVPVRNEQEALPDTYALLTRALEELDLPFEVVVVDNGSTDRTEAIMREICAKDERWKYMRLSRDFEYQNSITAGMLAAKGDAIMVIDADLQDPPELIREFVAKWQQGYDIVYGIRERRTGESLFRVIATRLAMRFISWMSDEVKLPLHSADFRLLTRRARDAFALLPESNRYVRGLIHWLGFRQIGIPYVRRGRRKGRSKNNLLFLLGFTFHAVFNFSFKPLRMFSLFGLAALVLAGVLGVVYLVMSFLTTPPPGITTILLLLLTHLGVLSLGIGILGEYIARVYAESKRRPLWLVDYTLNLGTPALARPIDAAGAPRPCTGPRACGPFDAPRPAPLAVQPRPAQEPAALDRTTCGGAAETPPTPSLSMVVPVLNEEDVLGETYAQLNGVLESLGLTFEVIVVDNGSADRSPAMMADICARDSRWKYIRLSRNFGHQNSITAGMLAARGDAIMVIDADLQDPPELIPRFIGKWKEGNDIVYGVRVQRTGESPWRVIPTMLAMRFITWMSDEVKLPVHSGDFRLITRRVRDAFAQLQETNRYVRGMIHWLGFRQCGIPYQRRGRLRGESKVNLIYLAGFMFNAVFNFSVKPLRMFSFFGAGILCLSAMLALTYVTMSFLTHPPPGITTVLILLLVNLGVISLGIGILGEYIARLYAETKRRPLWLVDYTLNLQDPAIMRPHDATALPWDLLTAHAFPDTRPPLAA